MELKIGSIVKFYLLMLLSESPKHGYELMKVLQEKLGRRISASQVYPFLNLLLKKKLIHVNKKGKREKRQFALTKSGRKFVEGFIHRFGEIAYLTLKPKLTTCIHCGCKVFEGGYRKNIGGSVLTFCCHHCSRNYEGLP